MRLSSPEFEDRLGDGRCRGISRSRRSPATPANSLERFPGVSCRLSQPPHNSTDNHGKEVEPEAPEDDHGRLRRT
jgi:hypothetical protein